MTMTNFIIEFEQKYQKMKRYGMELPDTVLAFRLLDRANLSTHEKQMAITNSTDLTFESMRSALKRIFCRSMGEETSSSTGIQVKQEVFYGRQFNNYRQPYSAGASSSPQYGSGTGATYNNNSQLGFGSGSPQVFSHQNETLNRGTNPINKYGKRSRCSFCQSLFHWAKDCPDKKMFVKMTEDLSEEESETELCNITLFTNSNQSHNSDQEIFVIEAFGSAVLDTACTKTVSGETWLNNFLSNMSPSQLNKVKSRPSRRAFRFGDGKILYSFKCVTLPIRIGQVICDIEIEVIESDIPLLLSKHSLKKAGTVLDLEHDKALMFGQSLCLEFTSSGHYCINVFDFEEETSDRSVSNEVLLLGSGLSRSELIKCLIKIHKQFGHASSERLKRLLKSAGTYDSSILNLLEEVIKQCDVCVRYKNPTPRPVVGLPLASQYNETVAVDLHQLGPNVWYLHMIDEFTRFSAACIIRSKHSSVFVNSFLLFWISIHGAPKKLFSDNGGEFCNKEVQDMAENLNIELKTTPGYSPWSNGLMERHNKILTEILQKVCADNKCTWEIGLAWALMAKNSLISVHGFSPYQLVFGQAPNLPSILVDSLPALEGVTRSAAVGQHISALHSARQAFTEAECSEKIRRALRKQTRSSCEPITYEEKVYYKRPDSTEWKGPATVIGQDGVVVFVKHGSSYVRVHQCRLTKTSTINGTKDVNESTQDIPDNQITPPVLSYEDENVSEDNVNPDVLPRLATSQEMSSAGINLSFKTGQIITFTTDDNDCKAEVISRAGKATGKHKNWYNIKYLDPVHLEGEEISINLETVGNLKLQISHRDDDKEENDDSPEITENVVVNENVDFIPAKLDELESWQKNGVYMEIDENGQKPISTRWICTMKQRVDGIKPKARLVIRGFEEIDNELIPKDSPTCSTEALRVVLAILAQEKWIPHSMDIKTAFLQGSELSRDVFIKPPVEANSPPGKIWQLKKCVYGLGDASLYWYNRVREVMIANGGKISSVDPAVFYWYYNGHLEGILASHVDDFVWGGSVEFQSKVINKIRDTFLIGSEEVTAFRYLGIEIILDNGCILLKQEEYINNLQPAKVDKTLNRSSKLDDKYLKLYRSKVGQILWVARQSRPDIMFDVCKFAANVRNATVQNLFEINKLIGKLKSEAVCLKFQNLGEENDLELVVFSDVSLGNLPDGGSQGGHFIILKGRDGSFSPLCWQSKKIRRAVRSTFAAETLALTDGIDDAVFLSTLFIEITKGHHSVKELPITCVIDNKSLYEAIKSTKFTVDKRLRLEISVIKELIERKQIKNIYWSSSKLQLADCLTKKGASSFQLIKNINNGVWKLDTNLE